MTQGHRPTRPFLAVERANTWRFDDFPPETTVEHLLNPETWAHCAARYFKPGDEIIVTPQGFPYRAHLFVMDAGAGFAKVRVLDVTLLNADTAAAPAITRAKAEATLVSDPLPDDAPVKIEWKGPALKYSIIRKKDGEKLRTGFAIKAEAEAWAIEHLLALA